jgi:hypothetical protein
MSLRQPGEEVFPTSFDFQRLAARSRAPKSAGLPRPRVRAAAIVVRQRQRDTMTAWAVSPGPGEVSTAVFA